MDKERAKNTDIIALAQRLGLNPKRAGAVSVCLCPVHNEKTPSFTFYKKTNSGYCWGCGFSADTIKLTEVVLNVDFIRAIEFINGEKITPARVTMEPEPEPVKKDFSHIYGGLRDFCINQPGYKKRAVYEYLTGRGINPDTVKKYGVFAVPNVQKVTEYLTSTFAAAELMEAGLIHNGVFSFADYPLIFPYYSGGKIRTIQGRALDPGTNPKYKFCAGGGVSVFGADLLEPGGDTVVICEGAFDTLSAHQLFAGAVCVGVPGVNGFRGFPFEELTKFKRVFLLLDNDTPGQKKALELVKTLRAKGLKNVQSKHVPEPYKDVNDWLNGQPPAQTKEEILSGFIQKNPDLLHLIETFNLQIL